MISVDGTRHCKSRGINARSTASVEEEHIKQIDHTLNTSIDPQCLFPLRRQCIQPVLPLAKHSQISVLSLRVVIINTFAHPYFNPFANRTSHEPRSSPITARIVACSEPPPSAVDLLAEHARTRPDGGSERPIYRGRHGFANWNSVESTDRSNQS